VQKNKEYKKERITYMGKKELLKLIGKKIKLARKKMGKSLQEFSHEIGISLAKLSRIEKGEVEPGAFDLFKISQIIGEDIEYLYNLKTASFVYIPLVEGKISAGNGIIPNNVVIDFLAFRSDWIKKKGNPERMALIQVSGDSMYPTLQNGDLVMIDLDKKYLDPQGGIYAITVGEEIMIKRLQTLPAKGKIKIISDNKLYESYEMNPENVIINGKVIWFGREI